MLHRQSPIDNEDAAAHLGGSSSSRSKSTCIAAAVGCRIPRHSLRKERHTVSCSGVTDRFTRGRSASFPCRTYQSQQTCALCRGASPGRRCQQGGCQTARAEAAWRSRGQRCSVMVRRRARQHASTTASCSTDRLNILDGHGGQFLCILFRRAGLVRENVERHLDVGTGWIEREGGGGQSWLSCAARCGTLNVTGPARPSLDHTGGV